MGEGWGFSSDREPHGIIGRSFPRDGGRVIVVGALDAPAFYRFVGLDGTGSSVRSDQAPVSVFQSTSPVARASAPAAMPLSDDAMQIRNISRTFKGG